MDESLSTAAVVQGAPGRVPASEEIARGAWIDRFGKGVSGSSPSSFRRLGMHAVVWVLGGSGTWQVPGGALRDLQAGRGLFLTPSHPCRYLPSSSGWRTAWIVWNESRGRGFSGGLPSRTASFDAPLSELGILFRRLRALGMRNDLVSSLETHRVLVDLLILVAKAFQADRPTSKIEEALLRIHQKALAPPSVERLARDAGMGLSTFRRVFRRETGFSPKEYQVKVRLDQAKRLALEGHSVEAIAARAGFVDPFYFMRLFRSHVGVTVGEYRKIHRL